MEELTKAQQLIEVANWVKKQNPEFTKHFQSMRGIIQFYLQLPKEYDKKKSVVAYISKGLKSKNYLERLKAERLSLIINSLFRFRYFKDAPYKWTYIFQLHCWSNTRTGEENMEVRCTPVDRCCIHSGFERVEFGAHTISIKTLGDARRAADRILADLIQHSGNDYETSYSKKLVEAMKQSYSTNDELEVGIEVRI